MNWLILENKKRLIMPKSLLFLSYSFFFIGLSFSLSLASIVETVDELSILLSIKSELIDPTNRLADWAKNGTAHYCDWTGIQCNFEGFVERLEISNMTLNGTISSQINGLIFLSHLDISLNDFANPLPRKLSGLASLKTFDASQNSFSGKFPSGLGASPVLTRLNASSNNFYGFLPEDLGNATSLESLDFRGSFFEGSVPKTYSGLKKLRFLGLSGNNFTGKIPREVGELSSLETLILGYNEFEGEIPPEIGNLSSLVYLDLAVANLSGQIPKELGRLRNLSTVYLYKNRFSGEIPAEIGGAESLEFLDLSDNKISGEIPAELVELKNLKLLNLMCNNLSGIVPEGLGDLTRLEVLELWKNSLTGSLPATLGKSSPLKWLDVSSNSFSGEIPSSLCDYGYLTKLILFNNTFSGPIPLGLSNCSSLVRVRIQNNLISGTIPVGFGSLPLLERLELGKNNLTGHIPTDLLMSLSLSFIDVSSNRLDSFVPSSLLSLPQLQTFMASTNELHGEIPDEFQDCPSLSVLDLSSNRFSGRIPESIASCEKLVSLNLKNNSLSGEIPRSISTLRTLAILDLSKNSLVGRIPENLGNSPALEMLNLSYNKLEGPVPHNGILITINPDDLVGNPGLCGGVLPPCTRSYPSKSSRGASNNKKVYHIALGFIVGIAVIFSLALAFFASRWVYRKWYLCNSFFGDMLKKEKEEWPWRLVAFQRLSFTSSEILSCIRESNIVGTGGTGTVYKAEIHRPYSVVAVKKLWRESSDLEESGGDNDLLTEVNLLGRLRHRNIVRLLGYLHNETESMMIYEYMPNGNLGTALHGGPESTKLLIDWVSRYNVAVGVAQGLHYLHHDCRPPVIHRDIKSNNILLDSNLDARIADFGLAKLMIHKNETISMVAGSYGYIAPEYGYSMKVDEKIDTYSYGVVLLELVTGKMPLDPAFGDSVDIVEWVRRRIRSKRAIEEALDPYIAAQCKHIQEEMLLVMRIALLCTAKFPKDRPSMRDVITMLGEAKPRRKSVCQKETHNPSRERPIFTHSPVVSTSPAGSYF